MYTLDQIKTAVITKGHIWGEDLDYDVNIVGIRNLLPGQNVTNLFDDWISISYKLNNEQQFYIWPATTDPGKKGVMEFTNTSGVARLVGGQYKKSYAIGLHKGQYEALCQVNKVKVYRDFNRDMTYDENVIQEGIFGINIHHAGSNSTLVENWSEGCQVFKRIADFNIFMDICKKSKNIFGNLFTYTLINSRDIAI